MKWNWEDIQWNETRRRYNAIKPYHMNPKILTTTASVLSKKKLQVQYLSYDISNIQPPSITKTFLFYRPNYNGLFFQNNKCIFAKIKIKMISRWPKYKYLQKDSDGTFFELQTLIYMSNLKNRKSNYHKNIQNQMHFMC